MAHYHLVHFMPPNGHHGHGFDDIIQAVQWGLEANGHTVTYAVNSYAPDVQNIIFAFHLLGWDVLRALPEGSIIYNLEQYSRHAESGYGEEVFDFVAKKFQIWDYSRDNFVLWEKYRPTYPLSLVRVGYAPVLTRIAKPDVQDIDVLIYATPTETRWHIFQLLCSHGLRVVFVYGFYGKDRDDLIARSKIVLNIGQYDRTFEIVRASFLMANRKAVVADVYDDISIEADIADGVMFVFYQDVVTACLRLLENDTYRAGLEERAFNAICQRDMAVIMEAATTGQLVVDPSGG